MRRKRAEVHVISPDRQYNNSFISKFINVIMLDGKKSIAERIIYYALETGASEVNVDVPTFFNAVIEASSPKKKCIPRRFGGSTYQVPTEIPVEKRANVAIHMIVKIARQVAKGRPMNIVLKELLVQAYNKTGPIMAAINDLSSKVEANQAFAHFIR